MADVPIETPLASGATDHPEAAQSSEGMRWYKTQGADKKWYTTQALSPEAAKAKIWKMSAQVQMNRVPEGTISAHTPTTWEWIRDTMPVAGRVADLITGGGRGRAAPMEAKDVGQLIYPERAMTPGQQKEHPVLAGTAESFGALTTPDNLLLMRLMGGKIPNLISKLAGTYFTGEMAIGAHNQFMAGLERYKAGDHSEAFRLWTHAGFSLGFAKAAASHLMGGEEAPRETPIAGSGKTEVEAKAEASPSQTTGSDVSDIVARIKALETKLAAQKKAPAPERAAVPEPKSEDAVEQIRRGAPETPPAAAPLENLVPPEQRATSIMLKEAEAKMAERIAGRQAEKAKAEEEKPPQPIQATKRAGYQIIEGRKPERPTTTIPERPAGLFAEEGGIEAYKAKRKAELESAVFQTERPEVGREAAPPEAIKPEAAPVQKAEPAKGPRESVRPAEGPPLNLADLRSKLQQALIEDHKVDLKDAPGLVDHLMSNPEAFNKALESPKSSERVKTILQMGQKMAEGMEPKAEPRSLRGDLGERTPAPETPGLQKKLGPVEALQMQKKMVEDMQADPKFKGVAKSRLQEIAAERIREQRGSFEMGGPEDIRKRRELRIKTWIGQLRNPKTRPETLDRAYKMLKAYGLSPDEIIRRVSGAEGFAEAPKESTTDRILGGLDSEEVTRRLSEQYPTAEEYNRIRDAEEALRQLREEDARMSAERAAKRAEENLPEPERLADINTEFDERIKAAEEESRERRLGQVSKEIEEVHRMVRDTEALVEGRSIGRPDISGVKSPEVEWLEKLHALPSDPEAARLKQVAQPERDTSILKAIQAEHPEWSLSRQLMEAAKRTNKRAGERGSLSFRRLSPEERERANPIRRLADILDRVADRIEYRGLNKEEIKRQQTAENIIRGAGAEKARSWLQVNELLKEHIERHDNPINQRENLIQFMDAGEGKPGARFLEPMDQAIAEELHSMFEDRWDKIKEVKGLEGDGIENYLAHIWEKAGRAQDLLKGLITGKRPLAGSGRFLKTRFYQYLSEGLDHGLTPATWNPIKMQLSALFDMDRFLMAHDIKDHFKEAGLVKFFKLSQYKEVPANWEKLNDRIFQPKIIGEGALKEYGTYYAPHEVAKIFNNYLSPGLGGNPVFDNFRAYGNTLNMISLGISGYHGTMISLVSATSDLALGLQKLGYGDFKGASKDILRGTLGSFILRSAAQDYKLGRSIQEEAITPTGNESLQKYVDAIVKGGGRFKQDAWYTTTMSDRTGFMNWLRLAKQGKFQEMAMTGVRSLAGPVMEKFVPRVKLGVAARMMEAKLNALRQQGIYDENTTATELGKIWDSVDNRAGQMVYDNLFWNKAVKDLAFVSVRAVGWDLGSLREYGGAMLADLPRQTAKALRGQRPELTSRLAFTIATPITIGLFGGMVHYMMTGQAPKRVEDYYFPGPEGEKVSFPSYMKDFFAFKEHPLRTAVGKLHPTWGQLIDLYQNADYYGTEIYHPGDDKLKQGMDIMKYFGESFTPLSFRGIQKRVERGESVSGATTGMFGFMPAPSYVGKTSAEKLAMDLASREWKRGPRTSADAERYALVHKFQRQVGSGNKLDMNELIQAWRDKKIQDTDLAKIYSSYNVPRLQQEFKELKLPDALAVMREATGNERVQLRPLLIEKYGELERYPLDTQKAYDREIRAYLK